MKLPSLPSVISTRNLPAISLVILISLAVTIGGASRVNELSRFVLTSLSLVVLAVTLVFSKSRTEFKPYAIPIILVGLLIAWICIQLIPLPPSIWTTMPGRDAIKAGFDTLNAPLPALPLSLTPDLTKKALLGFVPPIAIFLIGMRCSMKQISRIVLLGACIISPLSVSLGMLQVFSGNDTPLYFHSFTNYGSPVGFFANANHQAIFLVGLIPFLCVALRKALERVKASTSDMGVPLSIGAVLVYNIIGIVAAGSLAGYAFAIPILLMSLLLLAFPKNKASPIAFGGFALLLAAPVLLTFFSPNLSGLGIGHYEGGPGSRSHIHEKTINAVKETLPVGSGLGSFETLFKTHEDPSDMSVSFINHAHNDYLETALELGAPGLALVVLFLIWLAWKTVMVLLGGETMRNRPLRLAAALFIWTIAAHSLVDYPARTAAIGCLIAVCLTVVCKPRSGARSRSSADRRAAQSTDSGGVKPDLKHAEL